MLISIQVIVLSKIFIRKERKFVKHFITTKVYEIYQVDTVKLSQNLNMNDEFKYIFTLIIYFPNLSFESFFEI